MASEPERDPERYELDANGEDERKHNQGQYMGMGVALGVAIGAALSVAVDNFAFIGVGVAIGVALGAALSEQQNK